MSLQMFIWPLKKLTTIWSRRAHIPRMLILHLPRYSVSDSLFSQVALCKMETPSIKDRLPISILLTKIDWAFCWKHSRKSIVIFFTKQFLECWLSILKNVKDAVLLLRLSTNMSLKFWIWNLSSRQTQGNLSAPLKATKTCSLSINNLNKYTHSSLSTITTINKDLLLLFKGLHIVSTLLRPQLMPASISLTLTNQFPAILVDRFDE